MLLRTFEVAESQLGEATPGESRATLYRLAGDAAGHRKDYALALSRLDVATDEYFAIGERLSAADAQQSAGDYCVGARDWDGAIAHFGRQIEIIPDEDVQCRHIALASLANAYLQMGDYESAIDLYVRLKAFWESRPDSAGHLAMIARGHAACLAGQDKHLEAAAMLEGSVRTFRAMGLVHWETRAWDELARLYMLIGETAKREAAQVEHAKLLARA
jgi:tetratricopeptide (TPR) repeat protein